MHCRRYVFEFHIITTLDLKCSVMVIIIAPICAVELGGKEIKKSYSDLYKTKTYAFVFKSF